MKKLFIFLFFLVFVFSSFSNKDEKTVVQEKLNSQIKEVKDLVNRYSKYNKEIGFFIDMKIESGKYRFFVCNLKTNEIIDEGLVSHGLGSETGIEGELKFSNENHSFCTSLGKYSIGNKYIGTYGKAYILYGLDATNSNAFSRNIVLHQFESVPYEEQGQFICKSLGCPMVNELFFNRIGELIDHSKTKIILSVYY
ncbi:murein L,D-transpeptidase catalytic domain-containing protein [Flavobacterium sp. WC2430]|uniref:murein L,D-transpeptidase catalytic domain-containing protein n=1 Tax=Flavobacterium sp. WC2430 TaxID=3234137 RepID=UPI0034652287